MRMHHFEEMKFAGHVVSFWSHRAERSASEHVFTTVLICSQQIRQIGVAAGELFNCNASVYAFDFSSKVIGENPDIEFFAGTNGSGIASQSNCPSRKEGKPSFRELCSTPLLSARL